MEQGDQMGVIAQCLRDAEEAKREQLRQGSWELGPVVMALTDTTGASFLSSPFPASSFCFFSQRHAVAAFVSLTCKLECWLHVRNLEQ